MTRPVDPHVVRRLAECIELLPKYINNPAKMPIVQEIVQKALEQINSVREALARGYELREQGDDRNGHLNRGKKYRLDLCDAEDYRKKAEDYREPVTSVSLSDTDKEALKAGFDETGILELFERQAADIAEWLREHRHTRDAELFRSRLSFVCGEALLDPVQGVQVSQELYKLDLDLWSSEAAKPLCNYLRELADEMANDESKPVCQSKAVKLFGYDKQPEVNGTMKPTLTVARYNAVQALIEAGEAGLTKDQLDRNSGHPDARKLLKELAKGDPDWVAVILFPGTTGKRYRIK